MTNPIKFVLAVSCLHIALTVSTVSAAIDTAGTKYFVSVSPTASDDNPGTRELPLRTIAEAINRTEAGDTVVVLGGNYQTEDSGYGAGVIPIMKTGTGPKPIRIVALDKTTVGSFLVHNSRHIHISGFRVLGSNYFAEGNWQLMPEIVRDVPADPDAPIDYTGAWADRQADVEAAFATYFSVVNGLNFSSGIDVLSSSFIRLVDNDVIGFWSGIQCRGASDVLISKNTIRHTVNGIFTWVPALGLTNGLIIDNDVSQSLDTGIFIRQGSDNVRIMQNRVRYSSRNHIAVNEGSKTCLVKSNDVRFGGYYTETMQYPGSSAISLNDAGVGNRVACNLAGYQIDLTGIDGNGIILDLSRPEACTSVFGNCSFFNMGSGMNLTASPNSKIFWNVFRENGHNSNERRNGAGIKLSRAQDVNNHITRNVFFKNRVGGILSEDTLADQKIVDYNSYVTRTGVPLAWDSYFDNESTYETLQQLQTETGWELNGTAKINDK